MKQAMEHRSELIAYARSVLGGYAAAEDVVQEAMLVVVRKYDQFEQGTSMLAWCRSIVRIEILRMKQKRQRERSLAERLLDDAIDAAFEEFQTTQRHNNLDSWQQALEKCMSLIPKRGRRVLTARFVDELSYQQISERVGMTLEGVRKSLFRLKRQVRSCVETSLRGAQHHE